MSTKTERTRAHIRACAIDLVVRQGFDATTVTQIAAAAQVSHMTVFRHFATKEDILLTDPYDPLIAAAVAAQPTDLAALTRVRRGITAALTQLEALDDADAEDLSARIAVIAGHPGLRAAMHESNRGTHEAVVAALLDGGTDLLEAEAVAGAVLGALSAALLAGVPAGESVGRVVDAALAALGGEEGR